MPQLKPTRGLLLNKTHPLSRVLVGYWFMNEGTGSKVFDLSGNGNKGTYTGVPDWSSNTFGTALRHDNDQYVTFTNKATDFVADKFTVVWIGSPVQLTAAIRYFFVGQYQMAGADYDWGLYLSSNYYPQFFVRNSGGSAAYSLDPVALSVGQVVHLVGRYDGANVSIWVDGIKKDEDAQTGNVQSNRDFRIGGLYNNSQYADLKTNVLYLFNRALSASEIAKLYRKPLCMFERAWRPKLAGGQIVNLKGTSAATSSLSATTKVTRKIGGTIAGTSDVEAGLNSIRSLAASTGGSSALSGKLGISRGIELISPVADTPSALFNGMTSNAFKLGTTLSLGWFWVRVAGCSVLYRGTSMREIDFANILAVAEQDACEISPPNYISHYGGANGTSTYFYVVRRFNNCGYQERTLAAAVRVSIESNGELAQPQPNKVFDSGAKPEDGNKIYFVWFYCPIEQKSQPVCFNIYYDGRTGQIDYENPLAIIGYKGRKFYSFQSSTLEAGEETDEHLFAIRAEDVSGIENSSLARLRIQLDTASPDAVEIVRTEAV